MAFLKGILAPYEKKVFHCTYEEDKTGKIR